jgi:hypothetical protein
MMAMTTSSSTRVKPQLIRTECLFLAMFAPQYSMENKTLGKE